MKPWLRVMLAVDQIGSSDPRLACGTIRSTRAGCASAGRARDAAPAAAPAPASAPRRPIMSGPSGVSGHARWTFQNKAKPFSTPSKLVR